MESSLKNLLFRRRSKSTPPAARQPPQDAFQQTADYAAFSSGPAPKIGALPLKPSQEKQPRKSFTHTKARSDGLQQARPIAESPNIGRPRTASAVKPYFVGVSKPNGLGAPSGPSSHGKSISGVAAEAPPVPPLPQNLDAIPGPRYQDIMQFAARQQISRATFNEHIATRNMGLPRKSVDIFETEANQMTGGRYNEYVAKRNIELVRQSIDRFEEEVALRNAVLPDTQRTSVDGMRASRECQRHQSRSNSMDQATSKNLRQDMSVAETPTNSHLGRTGRGKQWKIRKGDQTLGSDANADATASRPQAIPPSKVTLRSPKNSWKQDGHSGELSPIPQSRTVDFMPPEWVNYGNTKTSSSFDGRTRSMTAAIPSRSPHGGLGGRSDAAPVAADEERTSSAKTFSNTRKPLSQHSTSKSLSVLEGSSAFSSTTSRGILGQGAEHSIHHFKSSSRTGSTLSGSIHRDAPQAPSGFDTSSQRSSMAMSTTSSRLKRVEASGRTIMDLTDNKADPSVDYAGHPVYDELSEEPRRRVVHYTEKANLSRNAGAPLDSETISSQVGRSDELRKGAVPPFSTTLSGAESKAAIRERAENTTSRSARQSKAISGLTDSQFASVHSQVTVPAESSASKLRQQGQVVDQDTEENTTRQSEQVYASPESLKSNDFTDPSRAFGVLARDFAISPTRKQNQAMSKNIPPSQDESSPDALIPLLTKTLPTGQDKILHHISSFTLPAKQPRRKQSSLDRIAFDEDAFQRKQAEARAALLRLEQDLQENFTFAFDSLTMASARDAPVQLPSPPLEEGAPIAPISRFSSVHASSSAYQNRFNDSTSLVGRPAVERSPQRGPSIPGLAMTTGISIPGTKRTNQSKKRNSMISVISETDAEPPSPVDSASAPAPTVPLFPASDRGRSMTSRQSIQGRMHSTASTGSRASAFSVPHHLVPERTSSIRDSEVPPFHIDDAGWE